MPRPITVTINGASQALDVEPTTFLVEFVRARDSGRSV